ncbi:hypothetical protein TNIN_273831 [Trichonephila inaurata madagascariensis]|uniref:Uncharacterized protein n=1 Tax=Trichonephila inaurata madagascariensis TaxID=2747483 RepID=A0A8X7CQY6_9ARAC|nr:hypothetical protein TNIN_273831 [Trichonephila inaurata madagascariensis]
MRQDHSKCNDLLLPYHPHGAVLYLIHRLLERRPGCYLLAKQREGPPKGHLLHLWISPHFIKRNDSEKEHLSVHHELRTNMFLDQTGLSIAVANGEDEKQLHHGTPVPETHRNHPGDRQEVEFSGVPGVRDFVHSNLRERLRDIFRKEQLLRTRVCRHGIL